MKHCLPRLWLMTDERADTQLLRVAAALPRGSGIIFRHYATPHAARRALFASVRVVARRRRLVLVLAGPPGVAIAWRADGVHGRSPHRTCRLIRTAPVHDMRQIIAANRARPDLMFLSPVFATRSHPDARPLGVRRFGILARKARCPIIALGGMTQIRANRLRRMGAHGWAAIDALST